MYVEGVKQYGYLEYLLFYLAETLSMASNVFARARYGTLKYITHLQATAKPVLSGHSKKKKCFSRPKGAFCNTLDLH